MSVSEIMSTIALINPIAIVCYLAALEIDRREFYSLSNLGLLYNLGLNEFGPPSHGIDWTRVNDRVELRAIKAEMSMQMISANINFLASILKSENDRWRNGNYSIFEYMNALKTGKVWQINAYVIKYEAAPFPHMMGETLQLLGANETIADSVDTNVDFIEE